VAEATSGVCQDLEVAQALEHDARGTEVDIRLLPHESRHDDLVEIGVRLKADHGYEVS